MEHYVALDVSLKLTAICIVDQTGKIEREEVVPSDPESIAAFIKSHAPHIARVGLETGPNHNVVVDRSEEARIACHLHRCEACQGCSEDADQQERPQRRGEHCPDHAMG
jgi:hypothetical protein